MGTAHRFLLSLALVPLFLAGVPASAQDIYDRDRIGERLRHHTKGDADRSAALHARALSAYRKEKNPAAAIPLFREAAALHPTLQTYYELGNALSETANYDEALRAYGGALGLDTAGRMAHLVYYNMACAESLANRIPTALNHLDMALRYNYYYLAHLRSDSDLANLRRAEPSALQALIARYDNSSRLPELLVGTWEDAPMTAERSNASYTFNRDGTFTWEAGNRDMTARTVSHRGRWRVEKGRLLLTIREKVVRTGGRVAVSADPINAGERVLQDYREETVRSVTAASLPVSPVTEDPGEASPAQGRRMVLINDRRYWRLQ
ncbi:MAG: tetratricopeptide repeat protein [Spirochaetes bacterium]|nr:tetratricopeptide repeat protein [Spirochaetota bacterium]